MIEVYDLRRLPEDGAVIDEPLDAEWLQRVLNEDLPDPTMAVTARGAGRAKLELQPVSRAPGKDPVVRVTGQATAPLATACVRCLTDLELDLDCPIDLTLFPEGTVVAPEDDRPETAAPQKGKAKVELAEASLDEGTYQDHQVDLPAMVREALLLEVSMNPSCSDEAGCAERTAKLIEAAVPKETETVDPRWAALEGLKKKLS